MRAFGGFTPAARPCIPEDGQLARPDTPGFWITGNWPASEVRTARAGQRTVALFGPCGITNPELGALAVRGFPDDAAHRWTGSYTVIEICQDGTTIWTAPTEACPVYVTEAAGGVHWSSSSLILAGLAGAAPDEGFLAARLLAPAVPALTGARSAFSATARVPAGHCVTFPADGSAPRYQRVWEPRERPGDPAARLRDDLAAAVGLRLDSAASPTSDLSGGLDSTALCVLARAEGRQITGVTVHPEGRTSGGDLDYAVDAAAAGGIRHCLMPLSARHAPYTGLDGIPPTDEPAPSTITYARLAAQLAWMRDALHTDCHLTGDGGDTLLLSPPVMLADLLRAGQHDRAQAEAARLARLRRTAVQPLLESAARTARDSRPAALRRLATALHAERPGTDDPVGWYPADPAPAWATAQCRLLVSAMAEAAAGQAPPEPPPSFAAAFTAEEIAEAGRTARAEIQLAEHLGVRLHNPFLDTQVVDGYLAIPLDRKPGPADYKPVLQAAMTGLFPPSIAGRTTKGDFSADHYGGMRANLDQLNDLADGELAALGLLGPSRFRRDLALAAAGLPVQCPPIDQAITAEAWLRAVRTAPPVAWKPAPVPAEHT